MQWRRTVKTSGTLIGSRDYAFDDYDPTYVDYNAYRLGKLEKVPFSMQPGQQSAFYLDHKEFNSSIKCVGVEFVCE